MIQRFRKLNILINRAGFYRSISGIQSLFNNTNTVSPDDEDISEEVIRATRSFEPKKIKREHPKISTVEYLMNNDARYRLRYLVPCSEEQAAKMLKENPVIEGIKKSKLIQRLDLLSHFNITTESIIENPFLLTMEENAFRLKLEIAKKLLIRSKTGSSSLQDINVVVPLIKVSKLVLLRAVKIHESEVDTVPYGSRIYFFSKKLNVEPVLVTKYFSTHMFMFGIDFLDIKENLETLMKYNIGKFCNFIKISYLIPSFFRADSYSS